MSLFRDGRVFSNSLFSLSSVAASFWNSIHWYLQTYDVDMNSWLSEVLSISPQATPSSVCESNHSLLCVCAQQPTTLCVNSCDIWSTWVPVQGLKMNILGGIQHEFSRWGCFPVPLILTHQRVFLKA